MHLRIEFVFKSGQYDESHAHSFVILAADYGADDEVVSRLARRSRSELLDPRLEREVPVRHWFPVLRPEQSESMDGAISVQVLSFLRGYPQGDPLASPHRYNGLFLTHNLVSAVMIRQDFNRPRRGLLVLGPTAGNRQYRHRCQQLQVQPSLSHTDTATGAARPSEPRTSAVRLRPRPPLGAERLARPIPRLPDRSDRPYGVVQKQG